jgi:hypothetical protein
MQTPLIALDPVVDAEADAYAAREVDGMVDEANSEIMMLARSSLESVMLAGEPSTTMIRKEDDPGANDGPSGTEVERSRIPETLSPVPSENHDFLGVTGGGSALLNLDESIPSLESMALAANSTRLGKNRVSEMRKSIDFIKERFSALKQIAQLDPATAAEGGWTEDAVEEELNKLKAELARERETLREALYATSPSLERGGAAGRGKWGGGSGMSAGLSSYNPNLSTSSSMSAARERLFSESVAKKLVKLTKRLDRTCKLHAIEVRRRRDGDPLRMRERFSPLVSHKLHPSPVFHLKPLFRGDKSPEGIHRQRRRARASITTRGNRRSRK